MNVEVTSVSEPWKFNDTADPMWTVVLKDHGEPVKTYDAELAKVGSHEAEEYTAKSGKVYWRTIKAKKSFGGGVKKFEADPKKMAQDLTLTMATNSSIQRQVSYKGVIDLIVAGKIDLRDMYRYFGYSMELLEATDWRAVVNPKIEDDVPTIDELGDDIDAKSLRELYKDV